MIVCYWIYHDGSRHGTFIFWIQNQLMIPSFDHTCQGWFLGFWCSNFIRSENWYWVFPNATQIRQTFQAPWHCSEPLPIASSQVRNWRIGTWTPSRRRERGLTTARAKGPWGFLSLKGGEQPKKFGILILFWREASSIAFLHGQRSWVGNHGKSLVSQKEFECCNAEDQQGTTTDGFWLFWLHSSSLQGTISRCETWAEFWQETPTDKPNREKQFDPKSRGGPQSQFACTQKISPRSV